MSLQFQVDTDGIRSLTVGQNAPVFQVMVGLGNRVLNTARSTCKVDTGYLRSSHFMDADSTVPRIVVGARARYAIFVHDGTRFMIGDHWLEEALEQEMARL
jgi:hypothetical protein